MKIIINSIVSEEEYEIVNRLLNTDTPEKKDIELLFKMPYNLRMRFFEKMGTSYLFKHCNFELKETKENYELYHLDPMYFQIPLYLLKVICPSTKNEHFILARDWNLNRALNDLVTKNSWNTHKFYRHGDVALIKLHKNPVYEVVSENTVRVNTQAPLTEDYFSNLIAEA